jgi:hypothetical protein
MLLIKFLKFRKRKHKHRAGENGELILVDDSGEIVDWNDLPEDVRAD